MSNVVTKVIDVRHKAPDQAIHELMQAAKDGFAVTKIATRFNHTHVYLEANSKQVSKAVDEPSKETVAEKEEVKSETVKPEPVKTAAKKTTAKTTATKKVEQGDKDAE